MTDIERAVGVGSHSVPRNRPADSRWQPLRPEQRPDVHVNILCASLAVGGAERIVHDLVTAWNQTEVTGKLFVMHEVRPSYTAPSGVAIHTVPLQHLGRERRLQTVALEVLASPSRVLI